MIIEEQLNEIMLYRSGIDFGKNEELKDQLLLGERIKLPARELVMIYLDIEKKFKITIEDEYIINGSFKTYQGILKMLHSVAEKNKSISEFI